MTSQNFYKRRSTTIEGLGEIKHGEIVITRNILSNYEDKEGKVSCEFLIVDALSYPFYNAIQNKGINKDIELLRTYVKKYDKPFSNGVYNLYDMSIDRRKLFFDIDDIKFVLNKYCGDICPIRFIADRIHSILSGIISNSIVKPYIGCSSYYKKNSCHIVYPYVCTPAEHKKILYAVYNLLDKEYRDVLDCCVHKKKQNLRLEGCCKMGADILSTKRRYQNGFLDDIVLDDDDVDEDIPDYKEFILWWNTIPSYITSDYENVKICDEYIVLNKNSKSDFLSDELDNKDEEFISEFLSGYSKIKSGLYRPCGGECPICLRCHENDNLSISKNVSGAIFLHCFRAGKSICIKKSIQDNTHINLLHDIVNPSIEEAIVSCSPHIEIDNPDKRSYIQANMGVGKSHFALSRLRVIPGMYNLIIVPSRCLVENLKIRLDKNFKVFTSNELDKHRYNLRGSKISIDSIVHKYDTIITCLESIHYFKDLPINTCIVDEFETCLSRLQVRKTNKDKLSENNTTFIRLLSGKSLNNIMLLDAGLSSKTKYWLDTITPGFTIYKNNYTFNKEFNILSDELSHWNLILHQLSNNKKVAIAYTTSVEKMHKKIKSLIPENISRLMVDKNNITGLDKLSEYQLLVYSPKIAVGFDIQEKYDHIHYMHGSCMSPELAMQMIGRVRNCDSIFISGLLFGDVEYDTYQDMFDSVNENMIKSMNMENMDLIKFYGGFAGRLHDLNKVASDQILRVNNMLESKLVGSSGYYMLELLESRGYNKNISDIHIPKLVDENLFKQVCKKNTINNLIGQTIGKDKEITEIYTTLPTRIKTFINNIPDQNEISDILFGYQKNENFYKNIELYNSGLRKAANLTLSNPGSLTFTYMNLIRDLKYGNLSDITFYEELEPNIRQKLVEIIKPNKDISDVQLQVRFVNKLFGYDKLHTNKLYIQFCEPYLIEDTSIPDNLKIEENKFVIPPKIMIIHEQDDSPILNGKDALFDRVFKQGVVNHSILPMHIRAIKGVKYLCFSNQDCLNLFGRKQIDVGRALNQYNINSHICQTEINGKRIKVICIHI